MTIEPTLLPYDHSALEPHLSADAVRSHYELQKAHVARVDALAKGTEFAEAALDEIVRKARGPLFDHAAQAWNDAFYWAGLKPAAGGGGGEPKGALADAIASAFGDLGRLRERFAELAERQFGAGWLWLLQRRDGRLAVAVTSNAATPLTGDDVPLLACSLWEHAYFIDYRNARGKYLDAFWHLVDWPTVAARMKS